MEEEEPFRMEPWFIRIWLEKQELYVQRANSSEILYTAKISSAKAGKGSEEGSGRTPIGVFRVHSKYGENAPENTVFQGRIPVGTWPEVGGEDAILARILWLEGLQEHNANTKDRYIYIHGTADVEHLGTPASHGCIRVSPEDAAVIHAYAAVGTMVFIV